MQGIGRAGGDLDGRSGGAAAGLIQSGVGIGAVTVTGSVLGGASTSGLISFGKLGKVTIGGSLTSADGAAPVQIRALGNPLATTAAGAIAIGGLSVGQDVLNARLLAGYGSGAATNPDAGIGAISVKGNWTASSIAAGVADATGDGFGRNDALFTGDTRPTLLATIASITIKGTAVGSVAPGTDFFGITAQRILKAKIGATTVLVAAGADDRLLDVANQDFRLVDFA